MCGLSNETLNTYFGPLDSSGRRTDRYDHPELSSGSVDYIAPGEYMVRPPQPPAFLFLIDVTAGAVNSGMVDIVSSTIRDLIAERKLPGGDRCLVGIMTFDTSIHFYNLKSTLKNPQMIVVNDFEEMFVPIAEEVLVPAYENEISILTLLDSLPKMFRSNKAAESCLGSAIKAASLGMKHVGGKLVVCTSTIPSIGELGLTSRKDNPKFLNTDREIELLKPTSDGYKDLATELTKIQICCDLFVATNMYMDLASIAPLAKNTAGDLRYYPHFSYANGGVKLRAELVHACTRPMGWEAVMRVRISRGWKITKFFGHLYVRGVDLLVVPNCHCDQTFGIVVEPVDNEPADPNICVQFALLYTNSEAERRIRVHTIQLVSSPNVGEIYNSMDTEPTVSLISNLAIEESFKSNLSSGRNFCHSAMQQIVTSATPGTEGIPNLAMFILGLLKSHLFRATNDVLADERVYYWSRFESIPLGMQTSLMYPRMFALHNLDGDVGSEDPNAPGRIVLPSQLPLSVDQMTQDGVFLIEDGEIMMIWIGTSVSPDVMFSLFGVSAVNQLNLDTAEQAIGSTGKPLGTKVAAILNQIRQDRSPPYMSLLILPHEHPFSGKFFQSLVEDRTAGMQTTYSEFLQRLGVAAPGSAPSPPPPATMPPMGGLLPPSYR
jgi:protein transport protein SEC24